MAEHLLTRVVPQEPSEALVAVDDPAVPVIPQDAGEVAIEKEAVALLGDLGCPAARLRHTAERCVLEQCPDQLVALAFPRTDWDGVAWLLVAPVIVTALSRPPRTALRWGWLFGTVFFLVLLRWLGYTFRMYSTIPWPLTWLPIVTLAAYYGLYVGGIASAVSLIGPRSPPGS